MGREFLFTFILLFSLPVLAFRPGTEDTSILNECLWNKAELKGEVECNDVYNHYLPLKSRYRPNQNLRIGSYNILRTSSEKDKKNLRANAEMINDQWDLMALNEVQPGRTVDIESSFSSGKYILPEYINLLIELQTLDPSWGLILSPFSQGSDAELFGFLYRANEVRPMPSQYCNVNFAKNPPYKNNFIYRELNQEGLVTSDNGQPVNSRAYQVPKQPLACPLALRGLSSDFFTKLPLIGRFESGNFQFSYVSLHLSFRGPKEVDQRCLGSCQLDNLELIASLDGSYNSSLSKALRSFRQEKQTQKTIEITEASFPSNCSDRSLSPEFPRQVCEDVLAQHLDQMENRDLFPTSCQALKNDLSDRQKYEKCRADFELLSEKASEKIAAHAFDKIVAPSNPSGIIKTLHQALGDDKVISRTEGRYVLRFFQVYSVMREVGSVFRGGDSQDVIVAGDFNLEMEDNKDHWRHALWQHVLKPLEGELFVSQKTSINRQREFSKNYDHFIYSPQITSACRPESIDVFNYFHQDLTESDYPLSAVIKRDPHPFVMSDHIPISMKCSTR